MINGTEKEFFEIPNNIKKIDGIEVGDLMMSNSQTLSKDDRSAVINAAAVDVEQKQMFSDDLINLLKKFNITHKEVISRILSRQIKEVLSE